MITLYLARHGQTEENIARIFQGHMPGTLTVEGIAQAEALRDTLRDISLDAVVSSDLKRCVDTAVVFSIFFVVVSMGPVVSGYETAGVV